MTEETETKPRATRRPPTSTAPAILAGIAEVQKGVGRIPKSGEMKDKTGRVQYSYVRNEDILDAIQKLLVENNIVVSPKVVKHDVVVREVGTRLYTTVSVSLEQTYYSVEDGSSHTVLSVGEAAGYDDKGTRKALTQAQKVANLLTFSIATGEDPDSIDPQRTGDAAPIQSAPPAKVAPKSAVPDDVAKLKDEVAAEFAKRDITTPDKIKEQGDKFFEGRAGWATNPVALTKLRDALKAGEAIE